MSKPVKFAQAEALVKVSAKVKYFIYPLTNDVQYCMTEIYIDCVVNEMLKETCLFVTFVRLQGLSVLGFTSGVGI